MATLDKSGEPRADVFIMGLPLWNPDYPSFQWWWSEVLASPVRGNVLLCLVNPNLLNIAATDALAERAVRAADLYIVDGVGCRLASRMRGVPMRTRFTGTDLFPRLFDDLDQPLKVFLYGASERSNEAAAKALGARHPMVRIVGRVNGYVDPVTEALPKIRESGPDLLMLGLGQPLQEIFMAEHRHELNVKIAATCGGMFDFFAGVKPRAPRVFRLIGLEWLFRLAIEPRRLFRRYVLGNPAFMIRSLAWLRRDLAEMRRARQR